VYVCVCVCVCVSVCVCVCVCACLSLNLSALLRSLPLCRSLPAPAHTTHTPPNAHIPSNRTLSRHTHVPMHITHTDTHTHTTHTHIHRRYKLSIPGPLIVVSFAIFISWIADLNGNANVKIVGDIPRGLPLPSCVHTHTMRTQHRPRRGLHSQRTRTRVQNAHTRTQRLLLERGLVLYPHKPVAAPTHLHARSLTHDVHARVSLTTNTHTHTHTYIHTEFRRLPWNYSLPYSYLQSLSLSSRS